MATRYTKQQAIFDLLKQRGEKGITQLELYLMADRGEITPKQFTTRLGAAVWTLKHEHGCDIKDTWEHHRNTDTRYKRYVMVAGQYQA